MFVEVTGEKLVRGRVFLPLGLTEYQKVTLIGTAYIMRKAKVTVNLIYV